VATAEAAGSDPNAPLTEEPEDEVLDEEAEESAGDADADGPARVDPAPAGEPESVPRAAAETGGERSSFSLFSWLRRDAGPEKKD
jgi:hypothetical protein